MAFQDKTKWNVTVRGFSGRTIYTGHGDDIRGNDAKHRFGDLTFPTDDESFYLLGKSYSFGDVCFMFPDGPLFIGNNPEMGAPSVEMRYGDKEDHRNIDKGVTSTFEVDGIRYTFMRPQDDDPDYKVFNVIIEHV